MDRTPVADLTPAVLAHVDSRELVELANALIRIPSFKTEETPVAPCETLRAELVRQADGIDSSSWLASALPLPPPRGARRRAPYECHIIAALPSETVPRGAR
jgi:hypothetical protein